MLPPKIRCCLHVQFAEMFLGSISIHSLVECKQEKKMARGSGEGKRRKRLCFVPSMLSPGPLAIFRSVLYVALPLRPKEIYGYPLK